MTAKPVPEHISDEVMARFNRSVFPEPMSGCWLWTGSISRRGYGSIWNGRRSVRAHRFSYEAHKGLIPLGMCVCHRCDNPGCVNPEHLFLGTNDENVADRVRKGRSYRYPNGEHQGQRHPQAKLSDSDVRFIRHAVRSGTPQRDMASRFRISKSHVSEIVSGKMWSHLS